MPFVLFDIKDNMLAIHKDWLFIICLDHISMSCLFISYLSDKITPPHTMKYNINILSLSSCSMHSIVQLKCLPSSPPHSVSDVQHDYIKQETIMLCTMDRENIQRMAKRRVYAVIYCLCLLALAIVAQSRQLIRGHQPVSPTFAWWKPPRPRTAASLMRRPQCFCPTNHHTTQKQELRWVKTTSEHW